MRSACPWLLLFLCGCSSVLERMPFHALDDLATTTPRNLAEAGHSETASTPAGVRFTLELQWVRETPPGGMASQRYELLLTVARDETQGQATAWEPDVHGCTLVDDESHVFRSSQVLKQLPGVRGGEAVITTVHQLRFDLPLSYQPRRIARVTVHWVLVAPQHPPIRISSRFRR